MNSNKNQVGASISSERLVKFAISAAVFAWDAFVSAACALLGYCRPGTCIVLYYHSIRPQERDRFAQQLSVIQRLSKLIDATHEFALQGGIRYIAVTFDDAFENFLTVAVPELQKRRIPSTMFVISGAVGRAFGPVSAPEKVMTLQQLADLPRQLVSIGSHTETHPYLPELDEATARQELRESKSALEQLLGREVSTFSFPFGGFSQRLIQICREVGYRRVFTTLPEFTASLRSEVFVVGRVRVDPSDWPWEFRMKACGAYRWLPAAIRWKGKLLSSKEKTTAPNETRPARSLIQDWNGPGAIFL
jgi:peptidoglycan/xylan/chitin deacetylase (PgdA/CDA1 family)